MPSRLTNGTNRLYTTYVPISSAIRSIYADFGATHPAERVELLYDLGVLPPRRRDVGQARCARIPRDEICVPHVE